jgi:hypothetical protein
MSIKPLFADPNLLHLERISSEPGLITIIVKTKSKQALCSQCHSLSAHLHSRYVRRLADIPWFGIAVRVEVQAQRLYCRHVECPQRIFVSLGACNDSPEIHQARFRQGGSAICSQSPVAGCQVPGAVPEVMGITVWGKVLNCRLFQDAWRISGESLHRPKKYIRSEKGLFRSLCTFCRLFGADPYSETPEESFFSLPFFFESFSFLSFFFESPFLASGVVVWSALGALSVSPVVCPAGRTKVSA